MPINAFVKSEPSGLAVYLVFSTLLSSFMLLTLIFWYSFSSSELKLYSELEVFSEIMLTLFYNDFGAPFKSSFIPSSSRVAKELLPVICSRADNRLFSWLLLATKLLLSKLLTLKLIRGCLTMLLLNPYAISEPPPPNGFGSAYVLTVNSLFLSLSLFISRADFQSVGAVTSD